VGRPLAEVDRREFLRLAAGAAAGFGASPASASELAAAADSLALRVHRATRNTRAGAIGRALRRGRWSARAGRRPGTDRTALPAIDAPSGPPLAGVVQRFAPAGRLGPGEIALGTLARLLHLTNGITRPGDVPLRAAPSAGALYAGEVYVVAARVAGLDPGAYAFDPFGPDLVRVSASARLAAVAAALEAPESIARAPVCILLTNVFERYTQRYANRGYRYALIDTGHIGENLRLAAASEGLATCSPLRFHDRALNRLLGCDGRAEAVCAIHGVGPSAAGAKPAPGQRLFEAHAAAGFVAEAGGSEPERYHAATSLVPGEASPSEAATELRGAAADGRALPERAPPTTSVAASIVERRSAAYFEPGSLALADLGFLLRCAQGNAAAAQAAGIELRVLAHRVDGLEPGIHRYLPESHRLVPVAIGRDIADDTRSACVGQERAGSAAAGFAMLADLASCGSGRDRRYRDLLIESGAIGQRVYLAAESIGLAARNLAAFFDDELNALLRADGRSQAVVHLTMVGPGT
jgi:SagB-type dehydrogenase family enzyme